MEPTSTYGLISLLPVTIVIIVALLTRRTLECMILGSLIGFVILEGPHFFGPWLDATLTVFGDSAWFILLFGSFGIIIALLEASGGAEGFSKLGTKFAKSRNVALMITWVLGIAIFIDDYLNNLGISVSMRKVTDRFKVSREFLAYVINTTGAAVCVLIPVSTWAVYMAGLYESLDVTVGGTGMGAYIASIPYIFYAWVAVLIAPLFIFKVIPLYGPMKKAELRAAAGDVFPESYHLTYAKDNPETAEGSEEGNKKTRALNFLIPMLVLIGVTIYTSDILVACILCVVLCAILYLPQKLMKPTEFCDTAFKGFTSMSFVTGLVLTSFILSEANTRLGLTPYVIEKVEPLLSPLLLPVVTFILVSFLAFASGSFWGIAAIVFPIVIPLPQAMDANVFLVGAAIISGTTFASHTCFYADAVTLISAGTQIQNIDYARTSIPIAAIPFALAVILYLAAGFIF